MTMLARIEASDDSADRRASHRRRLSLHVPGGVFDRAEGDVLIHDLSRNGLLIETSAELEVGARLEIALPETGVIDAGVVWGTGRFYGCQFESPIAARGLSAALFKNPLDPSAETPPEPLAAQADDRLTRPTRARFAGAMALAGWVLVLTPILVASIILS